MINKGIISIYQCIKFIYNLFIYKICCYALENIDQKDRIITILYISNADKFYIIDKF